MDVSASGWHWRFTVSVPIQWPWNQCGGGCTSCLRWLKDFCHFSLFNFSALPFFLTFFSFWIWLKIFLVAISCLVIVCTLSVHSYNKLFSVVSWILCRKMFKSSHKSSSHEFCPEFYGTLSVNFPYWQWNKLRFRYDAFLVGQRGWYVSWLCTFSPLNGNFRLLAYNQQFWGIPTFSFVEHDFRQW